MTSSLQAAYNEVALANSRLRVEIERCREEQRAVLKHVEELRAEIERLKADWKPERNSLVEERLLNEAKAEIERLTEENSCLVSENIENEAAIAYVRQRSQRACEILNEFDNTKSKHDLDQ